jgi:DNA modification methylase/ParB-like chromosome segregation protein Spo0J
MPFMKISNIIVTNRARKELGDDYEDLKESIKKRGLLHPICVSKADSELVAGFRRLQSHIDLGLEKIEVRYREDLSPLEKKLLELEENIHKALTWDEQAVLRAQIHILQQEIHGKAVKGHKSDGYSLEDTARDLSLTKVTLSQDLRLANALQELPELRKITSRRQALKAIDRIEEVALLTALANIDAESQSTDKKQPYITICGDALVEIPRRIDDEVVDLVIFDPPWGIDAHIIASSRGPRGEKTSYADDTATTATDLSFKLLPELHRVMKPDAHMYMFIGAQYRELYYDFLTNYADFSFRIQVMKYSLPSLAPQLDKLNEAVEKVSKNRSWSFHVEIVPLIWVKEGGGFTDFDYKFMPRYETILFCSKGIKKPLNEITSNVLEYRRSATTERIHTQEKPIELIQKFIKLSSQPNEIVLDPCAGSFVTSVAATLAGRRSIAIEKDEICYAKGLQRLTGLVQINEEDEECLKENSMN